MPRYYSSYDPYHHLDDPYVYYDAITGYRRRAPVMVHDAAPVIIHDAAPVVISSSAQPSVEVSYQNQSAAAPGPDINITIPHGDPFGYDNNVIAQYLAESHRARGLQPGLGDPRQDAEHIVDMMQRAGGIIPEQVARMGREGAITFVMSKFASLGYRVPGF